MNLRRRFWVQTGMAVITGAALLLTVLWKDWIEIVFGVDPDGGSGALEWAIVVALAATTATFSLMARSEWRRGMPPAGVES